MGSSRPPIAWGGCMGDEERLSGVLGLGVRGDSRMRQLIDYLDLTRNGGPDEAGRIRADNCY